MTSDRVAHITLTGTIDEQKAEALLAMVAKHSAEVEVLHLLITSPGGDAFAALGVSNIIRASPLKVVTHNTGLVGSAAMFVFLAGVERYSEPVATFLIHPSYAAVAASRERMQVGGIPAARLSTQTLREELAALQAIDEAQIAVMLERGTFRDRQEVEDILFRGAVNYSPTWAKEKGIVHDIGHLRIDDSEKASQQRKGFGGLLRTGSR